MLIISFIISFLFIVYINCCWHFACFSLTRERIRERKKSRCSFPKPDIKCNNTGNILLPETCLRFASTSTIMSLDALSVLDCRSHEWLPLDRWPLPRRPWCTTANLQTTLPIAPPWPTQRAPALAASLFPTMQFTQNDLLQRGSTSGDMPPAVWPAF